MNVPRSLGMDNRKVYGSKSFRNELNLMALLCYFSTFCDPRAIYQGMLLIIVENWHSYKI